GFDYTYDKRFYDRLHARDAGAARGHLTAHPQSQRRSPRSLGNHHATAPAPPSPRAVHEAAGVLAFLVPGLRFIHEGQRSGRKLRASNHLRRRAPEPIDQILSSYYRRLLACLRRPEVRDGDWTLLEARPAWEGNTAWE